jgi:hypothetical protein
MQGYRKRIGNGFPAHHGLLFQGIELGSKQDTTPSPSAVPASTPTTGAGSRQVEGYLALEYLGRALLFGPVLGMLFTTLWYQGIALLVVLAPLAWLGRGGRVPTWMLARSEPASD